MEISFLHMNHQKIDNIPSVLFMYLKVVQKLVDVYPVTKTVWLLYQRAFWLPHEELGGTHEIFKVVQENTNKFDQLIDSSFWRFANIIHGWTDQQTYPPIEMQLYISVMFLGLPEDTYEEKP